MILYALERWRIYCWICFSGTAMVDCLLARNPTTGQVQQSRMAAGSARPGAGGSSLGCDKFFSVIIYRPWPGPRDVWQCVFGRAGECRLPVIHSGGGTLLDTPFLATPLPGSGQKGPRLYSVPAYTPVSSRARVVVDTIRDVFGEYQRGLRPRKSPFSVNADVLRRPPLSVAGGRKAARSVFDGIRYGGLLGSRS